MYVYFLIAMNIELHYSEHDVFFIKVRTVKIKVYYTLYKFN